MKALFTALFLALFLAPQVVVAQEAIQFLMPPGPYRDSCTECVKKEHLLSCLCKANDGRQNESQFDLETCPGDIINENGVLQCSPKYVEGVCRDKTGWRMSKQTYVIAGSVAIMGGLGLLFFTIRQGIIAFKSKKAA